MVDGPGCGYSISGMHASGLEEVFCRSVDPFFGTAEFSGAKEHDAVSGALPRIDREWKPIRELFGATHPGASEPRGMVSCVAFGMYGKPFEPGYPSGYNGKDFFGFGHFNQSGTGTIRWYYDYFLLTPDVQFHNPSRQRTIVREEASPGRYGCLLNDGIACENIARRRSMLHRFHFPAGKPWALTLDAAHVFLPMDPYWTPPENFTGQFPREAWVRIAEAGTGEGFVLMDGHPIYFVFAVEGGAGELSLFEGEARCDSRELRFKAHPETAFGFVADGEATEEQVTVELRIGFSFQSIKRARAALDEEMGQGQSHEEVHAASRSAWEEYARAIKVRGGAREHRQLFRDCWYKAGLKPALLPAAFDENPLWEGAPFVSDISTTWDMHGTSFPLMLLLDREAGAALLRYFVRAFRHFGAFPPAVMMRDSLPWVFSKQASVLGCVILAEGYHLGYRDFDWEEALDCMLCSLRNERGESYLAERPLAPSITHNLDFAYGFYCASQVAAGLGQEGLADELRAASGHWRFLYDHEAGLLREFSKETHVATDLYPRQWFRFYEGDRGTYSFRVWHDMAGLRDFLGEDLLLQRLDEFFGFRGGKCDSRFQGLNNESDYTVPFAYDHLGRADRRQQVIRTALLHRFGNGRGGLPGNDDSGALTSWVVWNAIGLFPMAGQGRYYIGSPLFEETLLTINGCQFRIRADRPGASQAFVAEASLNGQPLDRLSLDYEDLAVGGELELRLSDDPESASRFQRFLPRRGLGRSPV